MPRSPSVRAAAPAVVSLKNLVTMNLYNCGGLVRLPDHFDRLESLTTISLQGCEKLVEINASMADCPSLKTLTLWGAPRAARPRRAQPLPSPRPTAHLGTAPRPI